MPHTDTNFPLYDIMEVKVRCLSRLTNICISSLSYNREHRVSNKETALNYLNTYMSVASPSSSQQKQHNDSNVAHQSFNLSTGGISYLSGSIDSCEYRNTFT